MRNNRLHARLDCSKTCRLQWHGLSYQATITNLSIVAMGLHFDGLRPDVRIGDDCVIFLFDNKQASPYEVRYQVIRIHDSDIAVGIADTIEQ